MESTSASLCGCLRQLVEHDLDELAWPARIVIYDAANKDTDLVAGLSTNWDAQKDEVSAVVFNGKKSSIFRQ
jgi:hypothetical protein